MKNLLAAILLTVSALALPAQEGLRIVTQVSAAADIDAAVWGDSLDRALARSDRVALVIHARESAIEEAAREAFPLAIVVSISAEGPGFSADWTLVHPASRAILAQGTLRATPETAQDREEYFWLGLLQAVTDVRIPGRDLTITAPAGTVIQGFGTPVIIGETGSAIIDVTIPAVYAWKAMLAGFESRTGIYTAGKAGETLAISLVPVKKWKATVSIRDMAFPELHAEWGFLSNWIALRAGFNQRLAGLSWDSDSSGYDAEALRHSGLLEPELGGMLYLREEGKRVRPYLAADINLRLCRSRNFLPDPHAPLRVAGCFGIDWMVWKDISLYIETGVDYFPWADLSRMNYIHERSGVTATFPDGQFVNLPTGLVGLRYRLP